MIELICKNCGLNIHAYLGRHGENEVVMTFCSPDCQEQYEKENM